tara:strand:+ start:1515 stop:2141 length:627 start_codon:yes stop_codon:yes gene_type:complete
MNEQLRFLNSYCDFSNPNWVWVIKGLTRNKDNYGMGERFMHRRIITKPEDFETSIKEIRMLATDPDTFYRLYVSLNARDVVKGLFQFQKKMIDIGQGLANGYDDHLAMSKKIGSIWKTELEQSNCRGTKRFLLDIDNADEIQATPALEYLTNAKIKVHAYIPTVSGVHVVFDAFDTRGLLTYCKEQGLEVDLKRDSMVYLDQWKGKHE